MIWNVIIFLIGLFTGTILGIIIARAISRANKTDGIEMPQISGIEKYVLRFGVPLCGMIALITVLKPENLITVLYKICMVLVAFVLCELIWAFAYKPVFGKIEELETHEKRTVLIFRGVLYLAVVLGITWGL